MIALVELSLGCYFVCSLSLIVAGYWFFLREMVLLLNLDGELSEKNGGPF